MACPGVTTKPSSPNLGPMTTMTIYVSENSPDSALVQEGLRAFNAQHVPPAVARPLHVIAKAGGEVLGGLIGVSLWNWFFIRDLWVTDSHRRTGVGSKIIKIAEQAAKERGCEFAHLDTFSFQARGFYEKNGYHVFGTLPNYPRGSDRFYLMKQL